MLISTTIFLFFLFLTYALFLLASRKADARDERLEQRVAEALRESDTASASYEGEIRITRDDSIGGNPTVNRLLSSLDFVKRLDRMIKQADVHTTVSRLLGFSAVAGLMG